MANDIIKLTTKHRINEINRNNPRPVVTDWNEANLRRVNVVDGDTVLLSHWATIEYQNGTVDDLVMTGATALRAVIRADLTGSGVIIGTQTSYNQTGDATIEDLANGKVTWLMTVGEISYAITSVDAGTNTLTIQGDYTAQFANTNACRISGSTGNDGNNYTISGTPTYSASTNLTTIVLNDPDGDFTDATADGNFIHSAVQNLTFSSLGTVTAYIEYEYTDASSRVQTILPSFECRLIVQQNTGNTGNPAGSSLTYLTSAEIAASYGTQALFYTFSTTTTAADPGAGVLRFDSATPASVTGIYVDDSPANISGLDLGSLFNVATGKQILIVQRDTPANFLYADIDSVADGTGYWDLTVTVLDSGVLPDNSANLSVFMWQGSAVGDVVGPGSATDNAITRYDGTTGKLIQNSAVTIDDTGIIAGAANVGLSGDVVFAERADHASTPTAGGGYLWVRSDTPNVLVFTDDAGTDHVLTAFGSGDVTAASTIADNAVVRGDGGSKGVQQSGVTIDDSDNVAGITSIDSISGDIVMAERADHASTPGAGYGYIWTKNTTPSTLIFTDDSGADTTLGSGGGISAVVDDTTPQLGGQLDVNGQAIGDGTRELITFTEDASAVNHVNIENQATGGGPIISAAGDDTNVDLNLVGKGAGNVKVGVYTFDGDQSVGAGQDNYVLTYDNGTGLVSLEAATGGGISDGDTLATGLTFPVAGLHILDTNASHDLIISPGSDLTADRTLTLTTGDASRTITLGRDVDLSDGGTFADLLAETQSLAYTFSTTTADADPGAGVLRFNNATPASVTIIYIDDSPSNISGLDLGTVFDEMTGNRILITQKTDTSKFILGDVTADVDGTGYWKLTITVDDSGTLPDNGAELAVMLLPGAGGGISGSVSKYIRASEFVPAATNGPSIGTLEDAATNYDYLAYDGTTQEMAMWLGMLEDWDGGTITIEYHWTGSSTATTGDGVVWESYAACRADSSFVSTSGGTYQQAADTLLADTDTDNHISPATPAMTVGSAATGIPVQIKVEREVADVADDMPEDALLFGIIVTYTRA